MQMHHMKACQLLIVSPCSSIHFKRHPRRHNLTSAEDCCSEGVSVVVVVDVVAPGHSRHRGVSVGVGMATSITTGEAEMRFSVDSVEGVYMALGLSARQRCIQGGADLDTMMTDFTIHPYFPVVPWRTRPQIRWCSKSQFMFQSQQAQLLSPRSRLRRL